MFGSVKTAVGRTSARGDPRQPVRLLLLGAAAEDQFARDLRAGAERADADIAAREFLGDDAHRGLAEAGAAVLLGDGQAEHAERAHLLDDLDRDQLVAAGASRARAARRARRRSGGTGRGSSRSRRRGRWRRSGGAGGRRASARPAGRGRRRCAAATSAATAGVRKAASAAAPRPRSSGRTISFCDIAMPPASCARYSPKPICRISRSVSPSRPARRAPRAQPAICRRPRHRSPSRRGRARRTGRPRAPGWRGGRRC